MDIADKTIALRAEAWEAVLASPAYRAFKGLDDAVKAMTGEAIPQHSYTLGAKVAPARVPRKLPTKRITQGDIAERVLKRNGEPLPIGRWLEKCVEDGIGVSGEDPLANFRSTASRDKRFYAINRNNMFFWWLSGAELPESWKEAEGPDLLDQPSASESTNQEGGDDHAAIINNLVS